MGIGQPNETCTERNDIMPSLVVMRDYVSKLYSGNWPRRVAKMPDYQVTALYFKYQKKEYSLKQAMHEAKSDSRQLSMFDPDYNKGD